MNPYANPYAPPQAAFDQPPGLEALEAGAVPDIIVEKLRGTRPWVIFLAIVGFLGAGFLGLVGMLMLGMGSLGTGASAKIPAALGLVYIVPAIVMVFPSVGLLRYGSAIGRLVRDPRMERLIVALDLQRSFWKLVGILTAAMIVIQPLAFMAVAVFVAAKGMR
jgi:hypothetical protein